MKLMIVFIMACLLTSCAQFADGTSVWGGGLWILPWLTGAAAIGLGIYGYFQSKSGSTKEDPVTGRRVESNINVPIYKSWGFLFGAGLAIATIVIILMVTGDK